MTRIDDGELTENSQPATDDGAFTVECNEFDDFIDGRSCDHEEVKTVGTQSPTSYNTVNNGLASAAAAATRARPPSIIT